MDHNGWHYNGDVGIRHGGYYWHQDSNDSDIFHVVRVVPASDWGGPDNQFQIEDGIVDLGAMSDKIQVARETCGYPSDGTDRTLDFEAILTVYGLDVDSSQLVQIGPEDEFWNGRGKPQEPRLTLPEDTSLREWIKSVYLLPEDGRTLKL